MSPTVRIVLGEMPRLMVDIIREAASRRDDPFEIAAVEEEPADVLSAARLHAAHAVILGTDRNAIKGTYQPLLTERPGFRLVTLRDDGAGGDLFWVELHRVHLRAPSADALLDALSHLHNPDDRSTV